MRGFYRITVMLLLCLPVFAVAQGSLVLVGGGSESDGGWSDVPYRWIVDHAANKKVAVISYGDEDNWIPDYFTSLGAIEAINIKIDSRTVADLQSTYDNLMTYDAFFFKGGDQSQYYTLLKDTRTMQAALDKFKAGGVMSGTSAGMAILSGVMFTAERGSVYPDETLADLHNKNATLADDFLAFLPGFLFDSHFTERGRIGRLLPFMAQWYLDKHVSVTGVGVDDRTALCIAADRTAEVFGTGTVSIYNAATFSAIDDARPVADSVHAIQLLHGHSIDLNTFEILNGPAGFVSPQPNDETGNYTVALSGGDDVGVNNDLLNFLVKEKGQPGDTVVVITAPGKGKAFMQKIKDLGGRTMLVETAAAANDVGQMTLRNVIRRSTKLLFVENDQNLLFNFLAGGPTGALLNGHMRRNGMVVAFVGEDSRLAGRSFTTNHRTDTYAAYYGRLNYKTGLRLLPTTVIMANTYDPNTTDYYENTTAAISYGMVTDSARYGVYLNKKNFLVLDQQNGRNYFKAKGGQSVLVLVNSGTATALAAQPVEAGKSPRQYAGFASMRCVLLNGGSTLRTGAVVPSNDAPYTFEYPVVGVVSEFGRSSLQVFPNPSSNGIFNLTGEVPASRNLELAIVDVMGRTLHTQPCSDHVDLSGFPDGVYVLKFDDKIFRLYKLSTNP